MREVTLNVLNVGQGLCSVVSGIKDNGEPYCGIFDCGTLAYNLQCSKDMTLAQIDSLIHVGGQKVITDIVISHQDIDHWSLLMDILSGYFEMEKGCLHRKNNFLCEITEDGNRLFTIDRLWGVSAHFEGSFENERRTQKIYYVIKENEIVDSFSYEGTFCEVGKSWEISVFVGTCIGSQGGQRSLGCKLICTNDEGERLAIANVHEMSDVKTIDGYLKLMEDALNDAAAENRLEYDPKKFGGTDFKYLHGHIKSILELLSKNLHSFSKIVASVSSVPENASVRPIQKLVWGGRSPVPNAS